jgi:predicted dehydrogenase
MGDIWCRRILPPFVQSGQVEIVAAVDVNPDVLANAREGLGIEADRCFTDLRAALDSQPADAIIIVIPPAFHEGVVDLALEHGLDILSEKPIADTLEGSVRIVAKTRAAGVRMAITMSHRFDEDKTTLREELRNGRDGRLDYLAMRFTTNMRQYGRWRPFRHEMQDPMLIEGSVHHLDILADLAGAPCTWVWANTWRPAWAEFKGDTNVLAVLLFENGVRAQYEAATAASVGINGWSHEYIRAECELATVILDRREVRRYPFDPEAPVQRTIPYDGGELVVPPPSPYWAHQQLVDSFLAWRKGGTSMPTEVGLNLRSMLLVEAAKQSSRTARPVHPADLLSADQLPVEYRALALR